MSVSPNKLPILARVLTWFALVTGALTILTVVVAPRISGQPLDSEGTAIWVVLGATSLISGYLGLRRKRAAFWLLFWVFLVQAIEFFSPIFRFSFMGPLSFRVGWGWNSSAIQVTVNLLAVLVCWLSLRVVHQLAHRSSTA